MSQAKHSKQAAVSWTLASVELTDALTDFFLSRQAMNATSATLSFYRFTVIPFTRWLEAQSVTGPNQVTARHVRAYLAELVGKGLQNTTVHDYARAIRTLLRFWHKEGYLQDSVTFDMPKLARKRLPVLTADELSRVMRSCSVRDKAILLFLADSGLRRAEACRLNWQDVNMQNGLIRVTQGKGQKDRSSVIGATTRRALLKYRRTLTHAPHGAQRDEAAPLFKTGTGDRFTPGGMSRVFIRLSKKTGIHVTPHCLRRTFVILSLRAGMDPLHLQALLGHESLTMVQHYAQMVDEDLLQAHRQHSPVDNLSKL